MRMNRVVAGMLSLLGLSACAGGDPGGPGGGRSVTIGLGVQQGCVSAISEAVLMVGPEGSAGEFHEPIAPDQSTVTFNGIEVEQGSVPFSVSVMSDNGTELYGKDTTVSIDAGTFDVDLIPEKRSPVLEVCPGHITLDRSGNFQATLEIINRGIGTLTYQAESPDCPAGPCLSFNPPAGNVDAGEINQVVDSLAHIAPTTSLEMRVQSPVGSVPVTVTLGQLPDVVVGAFEITGDFSFNFELDALELPASLTVRNDGNVPADVFKIAIEYSNTDGVVFPIIFSAPVGDGFFAFTEAPLAPGETATIAGSILWPDSDSNQFVRLRVEADSCRGEPDPFPCRVDEFDERNNFSQDIPIQVPAFPIP